MALNRTRAHETDANRVKKINAVVDTINAAETVAAHVAAADPHPQYLTSAEGNAAYDALGAASAGDVVTLWIASDKTANITIQDSVFGTHSLRYT